MAMAHEKLQLGMSREVKHELTNQKRKVDAMIICEMKRKGKNVILGLPNPECKNSDDQ